MTKQEAAWLVVRIVGVVFLGMTIIETVNSFTILYMMAQNSSETNEGLKSLDPIVFLVSAKIIAYSILSLYLLKGGTLVFRWLNSQPDTNP